MVDRPARPGYAAVTMPQSLSNVLVHVVFSTKERRPFLQDAASRDGMHRYLARISVRLACPIIRVGGTGDHVHLLGRQARTITLADWVKELKRASSLWAKSQQLSGFQWQAGYGGFSVSQSQSAAVDRYLSRQPEHHEKFDFQQEFRKLLKLHGLDWDELYGWD
jgi:putative transposase